MVSLSAVASVALATGLTGKRNRTVAGRLPCGPGIQRPQQFNFITESDYDKALIVMHII